MHAAEDDDVGGGFLRRLRELQRVAERIREILDLGLLIVVREHHRVALLAQARDLRFEVEGRGDRGEARLEIAALGVERGLILDERERRSDAMRNGGGHRRQSKAAARRNRGP